MSCSKQLTFEAADQDYPLDDAVYVPTINKILGAMGSYVLKFNASTAALEGGARVAFGRGPCRICYHAATQKCYVSIWNAPSRQYPLAIGGHDSDIFPVDPATLEIGAKFGLQARIPYPFGAFTAMRHPGPRCLKSAGDYIYFVLDYGGSPYISRINPANLTDVWGLASLQHFDSWAMEQFGADATNIYYPNPDTPAIWYFEQANQSNDDFARPAVPDRPNASIVSVEFCSNVSKPYGVSGNKYMLRVDDFPPETTALLDTSSGSDTDPKPMRLRYRSTNGYLYLPSSSSNKITVWDPVSDTVVGVHTGFDSPWDVVFTPTKAFAVQKGPVGLKEIT